MTSSSIITAEAIGLTAGDDDTLYHPELFPQ